MNLIKNKKIFIFLFVIVFLYFFLYIYRRGEKCMCMYHIFMILYMINTVCPVSFRVPYGIINANPLTSCILLNVVYRTVPVSHQPGLCDVWSCVQYNQQEMCFAAVFFFNFFKICSHFNKNVGVWCVL